MEVEDLVWYSPFVFFVGAILSFADPITDILTVVEFCRADHMTWFQCRTYFCFIAMFSVSSAVLPVACLINCFTFELGKNCSLCIVSIFSSLRESKSCYFLSQEMVDWR